MLQSFWEKCDRQCPLGDRQENTKLLFFFLKCLDLLTRLIRFTAAPVLLHLHLVLLPLVPPKPSSSAAQEQGSHSSCSVGA